MAKQHDDEAPESGGKSNNFNFGTVVRGLRRHSILSFVFGLATVAATAGVWFFLPLPKRTAYAIFHISSQPQSYFDSGLDGRIDFKIYCQTQAARAKSQRVLKTALEDGIADSPYFRSVPKSQQPVWLADKLKIDFRDSPEYMKISIEGDVDQEEMQRLIDAIAKAYKEDVVSYENAQRIESIRNLWGRFDRLRARKDFPFKSNPPKDKDFDTLQQELSAVRSKMHGEKSEKDIDTLQRDLLTAKSEKRRAQSELKSLEKKLETLKQSEPGAEAVLSALRIDPEYQKLLMRKSELQKSLDELKSTLAPGSKPGLLKQKKEQLFDINSELDEYEDEISSRLRNLNINEIQKSVDSLKVKISSLDNLEVTLNNSLYGSSDANQPDGSNVAQIGELAQLLDKLQRALDAIPPKSENPLRVQEEGRYVLDGIEGNRKLKYSLMAGAVAFLLGVSVLTFLEVRNRRIVSPDEISDNLGLKLIGTVPSIPDRALTSGEPDQKSVMLQSMVAESVDSARVMLLHGFDSGKPVHTVLVTSALPGEGKTMLACNLASSLARAGHKTLLVDGDLRRPSLHHLFEAPALPGLCELLRGETKPTDAVQTEVIPNLSFLPAGKWSDRVRQTLASNRWQTMKSQLESGFEYVVIDSSPLLLVTDPLLVARDTDGVVISVLRNVSQVGAIAEAHERLKSVGIKVLGVVVNGFDRPSYRAALPYYQKSVLDSDGMIDSESEPESEPTTTA